MIEPNKILEGDSVPPMDEIHWTVARTETSVRWECTHCSEQFIVKQSHLCVEGERDATGHLVP